MVNISAPEPFDQFAEKIAARTGLSRKNVVQVLAAAMIVSKEAGDSSGQFGIRTLAADKRAVRITSHSQTKAVG